MIKNELNVNGKKKRSKSSDRLTLSKPVIQKSFLWEKQVNEEFKGMIVLKRNDIINLLLEELPQKLSSSQLHKIKSEKLTDVQKAKWIYQQLKDANNKGLDVDLESLVKAAQSTVKVSKKRQKSLKNKTDMPNTGRHNKSSASDT